MLNVCYSVFPILLLGQISDMVFPFQTATLIHSMFMDGSAKVLLRKCANGLGVSPSVKVCSSLLLFTTFFNVFVNGS